MEDQPLASFSLTHVHYYPHDKLSYACAWLALVPQGLCVAYATLIWSTREVEVLSMFAGQMLSEVVNWVLKRIIREERPAAMNGKGYGMPSSHAQFAFFFAVSLTLFLLVRHDPSVSSSKNNTNNDNTTTTTTTTTTTSPPFQPLQTHPIPLPTRLATSTASLAGAVAVAASRVYLNYHTPAQVGAGAVAGTLCATAWFWVTGWWRRRGWTAWVLESRVAQRLRVRDLVVVDDLVEAEWRRWRGVCGRDGSGERRVMGQGKEKGKEK